MNRSKQIVRVSLVGIAANLALAAFKAAVGLLAGSIAVLLDAVNNLSDVLSSVITILGAKLANRPPDREHPYGHGRIEHLSAVLIALIILLAGLASFRESVAKILHPAAAHYTALSLAVIAAAVAVKFFLGRYVKAKGLEYRSESLVASGTDASFDAVISLSTLAAAGISLLWKVSLEGWLGAVISLFILKAGIEILLGSFNDLIGIRVDGELTRALRDRICAHPQVHGAYDLILHRYGPERTLGSVHIEVDDTMTAREIHSLTRKISEEVFSAFGIVLTVGVYAANTQSPEISALRQDVDAVLADYPQVQQLHGFYADPAQKRVTFDLVFSYGSDVQTLYEELRAALVRRRPDYTFDIVIDNDFSD
ncbi:MAG: cation transporter [Clostridia bacterium]|nr:cation transporter [Clostridia bacterium]